MKCWIRAGLLAAAMAPGIAAANPYEAPLKALVDSHIKAWASKPTVVEAIKKQNAAHAALSQSDIDALDKQWRAEVGAAAQPMITKVMGSSLSEELRGVKESGAGLYTEIFVMDDKGLNVGQSDVTSDYWQGDEAKWKKTFLEGPSAVHVSEVEQDESTQQFQAQLSVPVVDPATNQVIGAVTVGVNVDELP